MNEPDEVDRTVASAQERVEEGADPAEVIGGLLFAAFALAALHKRHAELAASLAHVATSFGLLDVKPRGSA